VTGPDLLRLGIMDAIIPEPEGGAHTDPLTAAANLKTAIITSLHELLGVAPADLLEQRYQRFRMYGTPGQQPVLSPTGEDA
jgi:acetyl-CoA carboxylase alpha subunit